MKITVYLADQNPHRDRTLGISNMTRDLLSELFRYDDVELETIVSKSSIRMAESRCVMSMFPFRSDQMLGRFIADNIHPLIKKNTADVWLYPKGYLPWMLKPRAPCVGIVHDTILLWYYDHYKKERSKLDYGYWLNLMKRSIARFDLILTISKSARSQILAFCDRFSIQPPTIKVTYESVRYAREKSVYPKEDYVIHIASKAPHKKTAWLVHRWAEALSVGKNLPRLKLVGNLPDSVLPIVDKYDDIEKMAFLDEAEYKEALGTARALIMPSEIEGFGLPAIEAYCLGTPACYVRGTAVDEVTGVPGGVGAFELNDRDSLFEAVECVMGLSSAFVESHRLYLQQTFSPSKFGKQVLDELKGMLAGG